MSLEVCSLEYGITKESIKIYNKKDEEPNSSSFDIYRFVINRLREGVSLSAQSDKSAALDSQAFEKA